MGIFNSIFQGIQNSTPKGKCMCATCCCLTIASGGAAFFYSFVETIEAMPDECDGNPVAQDCLATRGPKEAAAFANAGIDSATATVGVGLGLSIACGLLACATTCCSKKDSQSAELRSTQARGPGAGNFMTERLTEPQRDLEANDGGGVRPGFGSGQYY